MNVTETDVSKPAADVSELDGQSQMGTLVSQPVLASAFYSQYYPCTNPEQYQTTTASNTNANPTVFRADPTVNEIAQHTNDTVVVEVAQQSCTLEQLTQSPPLVVGDQQRKMSCEDHQCSNECQCQRLLVSLANVLVDAPDSLSYQDGNDLDQVRSFSLAFLLFLIDFGIVTIFISCTVLGLFTVIL